MSETSAPARRVRSGNFRTFWAGQGLAQVGSALAQVALPVTAVQVLGATDRELGWLGAAGTAAFLVVGLPAGALVDRRHKRRVMLTADLVRAVAALVVPLAWVFGQLALWQLYVVTAVVGLATVFFDVAYQSYVPILVDEDQIGPANSALEGTAQVARVAGPGLGGALLHVVSAPLLLLADALGYLASVVFLLRTRDDEQPPPGGRGVRQLVPDITEGLSFVARHPVIRLVTASTFVSNACATLVSTLFPLFVLKVLGLSPATFGLVLGIASAGGIAGAASAAWIARRIGQRSTIIAGMAVAAAGQLLVPAAVHLPAGWSRAACLVVSEFVVTFGVLVYNLTQVSLRQRLCPRPLLGRMNASIRFLVWGVMPLSALLAGWMGAHLGTLTTIWTGVLLGWAALVPLLVMPATSTDAVWGQPTTSTF